MARQPDDLVGLMAEAYRLRLLRGFEELLANQGFLRVAGVDEAGRGCLAGPVVAAAVIMDSANSGLVPGVDDSKRLDPRERLDLARWIRSRACAVASAAVSADVIDRVNILQATRLAMRTALAKLRVAPDLALIDAVAPGSTVPTLPVIRGDSMCYSVACASIIAKTERDALMGPLDDRFPGYGFRNNKGYGSAAHRAALADLGPSPVHRLTFRSVLPRLCESLPASSDSSGSWKRPR